MIGGEISVRGTTVNIPYCEGSYLYDNFLDISFMDTDSALHLNITTEQAYEIVKQLTDYLGKLEGDRFKRRLMEGKEVTF